MSSGRGGAKGDKRFRFGDEETIPQTEDETGIGRLLKAVRDPLGQKEYNQRLSMLREETGNMNNQTQRCSFKTI